MENTYHDIYYCPNCHRGVNIDSTINKEVDKVRKELIKLFAFVTTGLTVIGFVGAGVA